MRFNITMPIAIYQRLKEEAHKQSMTISEYIRYALRKLWEE